MSKIQSVVITNIHPNLRTSDLLIETKTYHIMATLASPLLCCYAATLYGRYCQSDTSASQATPSKQQQCWIVAYVDNCSSPRRYGFPNREKAQQFYEDEVKSAKRFEERTSHLTAFTSGNLSTCWKQPFDADPIHCHHCLINNTAT